jgi:hypothetical protein
VGRGTTLCSISSGTGLNSRFTVVVPTELGGGEALECVDLEDIEPLWLEHMDGEGEIRGRGDPAHVRGNRPTGDAAQEHHDTKPLAN